MRRTQIRSPGWAAFDLKQKQQKDGNTELNDDPYPPISNISLSDQTGKLTNPHASLRTFSSIVRPCNGYSSTLGASRDDIISNSRNKNTTSQSTAVSDVIPLLEKLQKIHSWADESLIQDILVAVNNDEGQASDLLEAMVSSTSKEMSTVHSEPISSLENNSHNVNNEHKEECISSENNVFNNNQGELSGIFFSVPVEPEWEEDDVYLSHRKDALKMMRSASQHSRAASNAFLRGDHVSAKQLSLRADEERLAAEKLNARAAKEILLIKNSNNDVWKLDLHGLHVSEAVNVLKEHLESIESQAVVNHSVSTDTMANVGAGFAGPLFMESADYLGVETHVDKFRFALRQRERVLQVITGTGNHSRGQASLPIAVRSFLIENGYRFDDGRPGVIAVRPKFRK
ncbi:hypothetical protein QJS10_CPA08g01207 [Acorus calamus]|uniref:Smr domain-containing protein n=1 Tax=Acorus calamus TaxID=4465 RepID=A0AAV9ECY8_ACOCL|nr:hypothetical protein QJS10_CPA08g01207 [Acorus calamus]